MRHTKSEEKQLEYPLYEPGKTPYQVRDDIVHNVFWALIDVMPNDISTHGMTYSDGVCLFLRETILPRSMDHWRNTKDTPENAGMKEFVSSFAVCLDDFEYITEKSVFNILDPYAFQRNFVAYHLSGEQNAEHVPVSAPYCLILQAFLNEISTYFRQPLISLVGEHNPGFYGDSWVYVYLDAQALPVLEITR